MPFRSTVGKGFGGKSEDESYTQDFLKCSWNSFEEKSMFEKGAGGCGIHQVLNKCFLDPLEK